MLVALTGAAGTGRSEFCRAATRYARGRASRVRPWDVISFVTLDDAPPGSPLVLSPRADVVLVFFSFTSEESYRAVGRYVRLVREAAPSTPVWVVGSKVDLAFGRRDAWRADFRVASPGASRAGEGIELLVESVAELGRNRRGAPCLKGGQGVP